MVIMDTSAAEATSSSTVKVEVLPIFTEFPSSSMTPPSRDSGELLAALLTLPEKWKTAMYLYYFEGYSVREIARAMGQPEGTVKSWLHRARGMLREALEEDV